jgi:hypothetical protein
MLSCLNESFEDATKSWSVAINQYETKLEIVGHTLDRRNIVNTTNIRATPNTQHAGGCSILVSARMVLMTTSRLNRFRQGLKMPGFALSLMASQFFWLALCVGVLAGHVKSQPESDELQVRVEVESGPHYVGQGFELRVGVVGADQRPRVEPPTLKDAELWQIGTDLKPLSASGIGAVVAESNLFVSRFRVVPRRAGMLEIPAIRAWIGERSGRSQRVHLPIRSVPAEGRPREFLGGVGRFSLRAEVKPQSVRIGQDLEFRITVTGPAAWGMFQRPQLNRYEHLAIGSQVEPRRDEMTREPAERTFVYRLRPTRSGEVLLPPVAIAAFEPRLLRYVTQVTAGVPVRVAAVPSFDPAMIDDGERDRGAGWTRAIAWTAWSLSALLLVGVTGWLVWVRGMWGLARRSGPAVARRYAAQMARSFVTDRPMRHSLFGPGAEPACLVAETDRALPNVARRISGALVQYLQLRTGRPPGALTPDEAREAVSRCAGSDELGALAARLAARCDGVLYRDAPAPLDGDRHQLMDEARGLFSALGQVESTTRRRGASAPPWRANA